MQQREGFTQAEKAMMMLSKETLEGLKITGIIIHVHCIPKPVDWEILFVKQHFYICL